MDLGREKPRLRGDERGRSPVLCLLGLLLLAGIAVLALLAWGDLLELQSDFFDGLLRRMTGASTFR